MATVRSSSLLHQYKLITATLSTLCASTNHSSRAQTEERRQESIFSRIFTKRKQHAKHGDKDSSTANSMMRRDLSPLLPIRIFNPNPNLEIAFDVRTRNPVYVLERLVVVDGTKAGGVPEDGATSSQQHRNRHHFYEEKSLPAAFRSRNGAYHLSGYDRGHMAPAADFNHDHEQRTQTYNLTNISPQDHQINHKFWARLETWCRRVAQKYNTNDHEGNNEEGVNSGKKPSARTTVSTFVVTGPLWLPSRQVGEKAFEYCYPGIGRPPSIVAVPTHFFKVVAVVRDKKEDDDCYNKSVTHFACFVIPNNAEARDWTLEDALVRWTDLEAVTGLEFFSSIVDAKWKTQADDLVPRLTTTTTTESPSSSPSSQQLLLPPMSAAKTTTTATTANATGRIANTERHARVNHLCSNGTCQLYKKL